MKTVSAAHSESSKTVIPPVLTKAIFWRAVFSHSLPGECVSLRELMGPRKGELRAPLGDEVLISILRVPLWE